jgi:hypothetical protein
LSAFSSDKQANAASAIAHIGSPDHARYLSGAVSDKLSHGHDPAQRLAFRARLYSSADESSGVSDPISLLDGTLWKHLWSCSPTRQW